MPIYSYVNINSIDVSSFHIDIQLWSSPIFPVVLFHREKGTLLSSVIDIIPLRDECALLIKLAKWYDRFQVDATI